MSELQHIIMPDEYEVTLEKIPFDSMAIDNAINREDTAMSKSILTQFLELGQNRSTGGAYALSQDQSDFFLNAIEFTANSYIDTINREVVKFLCDINFGELEKYPELVVSEINKTAGLMLADSLKKLREGDFLEADEEL